MIGSPKLCPKVKPLGEIDMNNGTVLADPLDMRRIQKFFSDSVADRVQRGEASYLLVQDGDQRRPALITMAPRSVVMLIKQTEGNAQLQAQTLGIYWMDTDPTNDFLEFPLVEISRIVAVMSVAVVQQWCLRHAMTLN
jgi:hypothetical protein